MRGAAMHRAQIDVQYCHGNWLSRRPHGWLASKRHASRLISPKHSPDGGACTLRDVMSCSCEVIYHLSLRFFHYLFEARHHLPRRWPRLGVSFPHVLDQLQTNVPQRASSGQKIKARRNRDVIKRMPVASLLSVDHGSLQTPALYGARRRYIGPLRKRIKREETLLFSEPSRSSFVL